MRAFISSTWQQEDLFQGLARRPPRLLLYRTPTPFPPPPELKKIMFVFSKKDKSCLVYDVLPAVTMSSISNAFPKLNSPEEWNSAHLSLMTGNNLNNL